MLATVWLRPFQLLFIKLPVYDAFHASKEVDIRMEAALMNESA